jgi:hypothetical protein
MEILPFGFEDEFARPVKKFHIHTWEEGKYPEEPCKRCVRRHMRAKKNLEVHQLLKFKKTLIFSQEPKPETSPIAFNHSLQASKLAEERFDSLKQYFLRMAKSAQCLAKHQEIADILGKKSNFAYWKMIECEWKRQRPFFYAHNSVRE